MKTQNLTELATIISKLTWAEMNYFTKSDAFGYGYSSGKPENVIQWAEKQLAPDIDKLAGEVTELKVA